jgi:glycosyltransferase involved in cell wall biosynthesis
VTLLYLADIRFPLERANGIQSMETCCALAERGHEVSLVVRPDSHTPARDPFAFYGRPPVPGLRIEVAPIAGPARSRRAGYLTFALGRAAGRRRQDLIFTRDLGVAALLLRLPRALRAPLVYEAHGIAADVAAALPDLLTGAPKASPAKLQRLARRDERVWRAADGYVTITAALARELERRWGPRDRIAVVPDGARVATVVEQWAEGSGSPSTVVEQWAGGPGPASTEPSALSPTGASGPSPTPFIIGYAGHLYPWKGADLVIEAVAALKETRGLIVGGHDREPDLARAQAFADDLDCLSRITFAGLIPPAEVAARLRECAVLVLPNPASAISREFTSPLKLFEYMASGRPIVASDLPSLREVLRHDENALLAEPGNPQALVAAIERIRQDPALGERLSRQALEDVRGYTWARRAERLETLFADVTGAAA